MKASSAGLEAEIQAITLDLPGSDEGAASEAVNVYLATGPEGHVLVDCGPGSTLEQLEAGLEVSRTDVKALLLTHIHLDHAGAAGVLARRYNWPVYVHARGATHLSRPERLLQSARGIYGAAFDRLWGAFEPLPPEKVTPLKGGETLRLAGLAFGVLSTPGHAVHHLAYTLARDVFAGDVAGIRVPGVRVVIAPTPPPDIQVEDWLNSLGLIAALQPERLHLAHLGSFDDPTWHLGALRDSLVSAASEVLKGLRAREPREAIVNRLQDLLLRVGVPASEGPMGQIPAGVDGLTRYWQRVHPELLG